MNVMIEHYSKGKLGPTHSQIVTVTNWNENEVNLSAGRLEVWDNNKREVFSARDFYLAKVSEYHYTIKRR